ncbi:MAG: hypothetical protein ACREL6_02210, partial [Gemmatimonadales bacterium]
ARVLHLPDSAAMPVVAVRLKTINDSIRAAERPPPPPVPAPLDSLLPPGDTAAIPAAVDSMPPIVEPQLVPQDSVLADLLGGRPRLTTQIVIHLGAALEPGNSYRVELTGIRNANGAAADAGIGLQLPERPPPAPADSGAVSPVLPDSAPPDTVQPPERP